MKIFGIITFLISLITMGFSQKLPGKQKAASPSSSLSENSHTEEWDFYFSNVNDKLASIYVDLGLNKIAPAKNKPNLLWITIHMNNPRKDGLSSSEESDKLFEIEDAIVDKLKSSFNLIYCGRITSDGDRDLYFYVDDTALCGKLIYEQMRQFPKYTFEYGTKSDKSWKVYFDVLYPTPEQYQRITNRRVVDNLEKYGDKLIKEREVSHWLYFKSANNREKFLSNIKEEGFKIINKDLDKSLELPFRLVIKRVDKVDLDSVNDYAIHLWKLAKEVGGEYDGWETSVEKD